MTPEAKQKIRAGLKAYWTRARIAKEALLGRRRRARALRQERVRMILFKALQENVDQGWPCSNIHEHREAERRRWFAEHDDSNDWELFRGGVRRVRRYGVPI